MTTVVAMICADGLVIGSDTKIVAGDVKWSEKKLQVRKLGKSPLVLGGAGTVRHVEDALIWMELDDLSKRLGRDYSFNSFLDTTIERSIPDYVQDFRHKYGDEPDMELLIGCIDVDGKPRLIEVYSDGDYGHVEGYSAIGGGSIFGEILLRKLYNPKMTIEFAERLVAYIIWEVQGIDNDSGEDMQLICIDEDKKMREASSLELDAYKQLPGVVSKCYDALGERIQSVNLEPIKTALAELTKVVGKS